MARALETPIAATTATTTATSDRTRTTRQCGCYDRQDMFMRVRLSDLKQQLGAIITGHSGGDPELHRVAAAEQCGPGDIVFLENRGFIERALPQQPSAIVIPEKELAHIDTDAGLGVLTAANVRLAHALAKQLYGARDYRDDQWDRIHPSAVVHASAVVDATAVIGPNSVISENATVGAGARIMANVTVENDALIGANAILHPGVLVGYRCEIGDRAEIGAGSIIGSEGFGFAQDQRGRAHKLPHTGHVVIEDDVRLGANCCIDRGTYGITRIRRGTKMDNLCHVAHNVDIGEDCLLTAMFCVAGSSKIGDRVMASGQTGVLDHRSVASDVILLHGAGVVQDITERGMYAGVPVQPLQQYLRNVAQMKRLAELARTVRTLEETITRMQQQ